MLEHLDLLWTNSHQHGVLRLRRGGGIETGKKSQHFFQFKIVGPGLTEFRIDQMAFGQPERTCLNIQNVPLL